MSAFAFRRSAFSVSTLLLLSSFILLSGCSDSSEAESVSEDEVSEGARVVQRAIAAHGGARLDSAVVSFDFRGDPFRIHRAGGVFTYERRSQDSLGRRVRDVLSNDSLFRTVEGQAASLSDEERQAVNIDLNSVTYFALLPYFLNASAAEARHVGIDTIRGTAYHQVAVTFQEDGGGGDWQDRFMYWFREDDYTMDYLAYAFGLGEGEEVGTRFRTAFNVRRIGGVRFADYRNYTADTLRPSGLADYPDLLGTSALRQISTVALDSVQVRPLDE